MILLFNLDQQPRRGACLLFLFILYFPLCQFSFIHSEPKQSLITPQLHSRREFGSSLYFPHTPSFQALRSYSLLSFPSLSSSFVPHPTKSVSTPIWTSSLDIHRRYDSTSHDQNHRGPPSAFEFPFAIFDLLFVWVVRCLLRGSPGWEDLFSCYYNE